MYRRILAALENGRADAALIPHLRQLASRLGSELLLVHVADGWVARHYDTLKLAESDEMRADRAYLEQVAAELRQAGLQVDVHLALGDPAREILKTAAEAHCDLIAMTTHGHRFIGDLLFGSTIAAVRHKATVPVLLVRAPAPD
ncbi:MAG: universal stress protein [Verrucomicrobiota bacterium]